VLKGGRDFGKKKRKGPANIISGNLGHHQKRPSGEKAEIKEVLKKNENTPKWAPPLYIRRELDKNPYQPRGGEEKGVSPAI